MEIKKSRKKKSKFVKAIAFSEMFVMVLASFAFAFIFSVGMVSAGDNDVPYKVTSEPIATSASNPPSFMTASTKSAPAKTTASSKTSQQKYTIFTKKGDTLIDSGGNKYIVEAVKNDVVYTDAMDFTAKQLVDEDIKIQPSESQTGTGVTTPAAETTIEYETDNPYSDIKYKATTADGRVGYLSDKQTAESYAGYGGSVEELGVTKEETATQAGSTWLSKQFGATGGGVTDSMLSGLEWAGIAAGASWAVASLLKSGGILKNDGQRNALIGASTVGFGLYKFLNIGLGKGGWITGGTASPYAGVISIGTAAIAAYIVAAYLWTDEEEKTETLTFKCMSWQALSGGEKCGECNKDSMKPCSEYRCKALGQACELLNKGTGQEKCEWVNRNDAISPGIKPWNQVLTNGLVYAQVKARPAGGGSATSGMVIQRATENANGNKCVDPYTPIEFGILTYNEKNQAEPAQCKIEYKHTNSFSEMEYYFGDSNLYLTNHSQKLSMPSISSLKTMGENASEGLEMEQTPGEYTFYVRCADANGNENRDEFAVRFCIDEGPDMTAPVIKGTNFGNQTTPVPFGQDNLSIEVYTNEPAKCFWEREDRDYTYMSNEMTCSNKVWEMNAELLYTCKTTLTSIEDRKNNEFFFRCVDLAGNAMQEGYQFTVIGTQPLDIIAFGPNGTIAGSTSVVKTNLHVETANGYNNGEAICFYSPTGENSSYIEFFYNTSEFSNTHDQVLDLGSGTYDYYFRCIDLGGNSAENSTTFTLEMDRESPLIVRAYNENNQLLLITDESSDCRYNTQSCSFNFNDGLPMSNANSTVHETEWTEQNYYIKCADGYNNQPDPTECSMVVRPYLG